MWPASAVLLLILAAGCGGEGIKRNDTTPSLPFVPDTQIAAGPTHIVEAVNGRVRISTRSAPLYDVPLENLLRLSCSQNNALVNDPRIQYDLLSGRFFLSAVSSTGDETTGDTTGTARWCLSVSATNNPTGVWWTWDFVLPQVIAGLLPDGCRFRRVIPDYAGLGIGLDKVVLTGNLGREYTVFDQVLQRNVVKRELIENVNRSAVLVLNKSDILAATTVRSNLFMPAASSLCTVASRMVPLQPVSTLDTAAGSDMFTFGIDMTESPGPSKLWRYRVRGVPPTAALQEKNIALPGPWIKADLADQPLPVTQGRLTTLGIIGVMNGYHRGSTLWLSATVNCPGSTTYQTCVRLIEVDGLQIRQMIDHSLASLDPFLDAYMPALVIDAAGNVIVVYNGSGNSVGLPGLYEPQWASVYVTGRRPTDPLGTVRPPRLLRAGEASFWDGRGVPSPFLGNYRNRWGDYSGISVDGANPLDTVVAGEYPIQTVFPPDPSENATQRWGTWWHWLDHTQYPP